MKVYLNRFPINAPWGGGNNFVRAFHKFAPVEGHEVVPPDSMKIVPDVVLIAGLDNDGTGISAEQAIMYKLYNEKVKLVIRVNENDARKATSTVDKTLLKLSEHVDSTIFVSKWLQDYFNDLGWKCKNQCFIHNGVDKEIFKPYPKLNNDKTNIVAHHWSDNQLKGFDIYEKLDEFVGKNNKFTFTYIGRDRRTFKNTTVVKPLFGKKLGEELGKYDVYISGSRFDPGPNHICESISAGMPTYVHRDGGGCVEFSGSDHVYNDWDDLETLLIQGEFKQNKFVPVDWQTSIKEYIAFLEQTCKTKT